MLLEFKGQFFKLNLLTLDSGVTIVKGQPGQLVNSALVRRWFGVGSALHGGTCPILSPGTLLLHCYYSASYLITLFCPGGVAGPPNADCYPTAQSLLCGWSDGLEWSTGCAAYDASSPLGSFSL